MVHLEGAGEQARAGAHAIRAAERAAEALAFDRAAALYERALRLGSRSARETRILEAALGRALANAGRGHEAARAFSAAARGHAVEQLDGASDGAGGPTAPVPTLARARALELQRRALEQLLISGHVDEGLALLERLGPTFGLELPGGGRALPALIWARTRLRLRGLGFTPRRVEQLPARELQRLDLAMAVTRGLGNVDPMRMALLQTQCVQAALELGEPARVALALGGEVIFSACRGSRTRRRTNQLLRRLHAVVEGIDDQQLSGFVALVDGMDCLLGQGQFAAGLRAFDQAATTLRQAPGRSRYLGPVRDRLRLDMAQLYGLECLHRLGELAELSVRLQPLLLDADQRGNRLLRASLRTGAGHVHWLAGDRAEELRQGVIEAMAQWSQQGFHLQHLWELWTRCQIELYEGQAGAALARLEARWPTLRRSVLLRTQLVVLDLLHLRGRLNLAAAHGARRGARRSLLQAAEQMARAIAREGVPHGWPLARLLAAGVASLRGRVEQAARLLGEAEAGFERAGMQLFAHAARRRRGALQAGTAGSELIRASESYFSTQRVVRPDRLVALLAPGFD